MARIVKLYKNGDFTCVDITINGKTEYLSSDKGRALEVIPGGVMVIPDKEEKILNNFKILISELEDNFGATTGKELRDEILTRNFFKKGGGGVSENAEVINNLISTDADKALSANMGRVLDEKTKTNQENISTNEEAISEVGNDKLDKTAFNLPIADENGITQFVLNLLAGEKLKLKGAEFDAEKNIITGLWNTAKTILSRFINNNNSVRTYTLQDRDGIIADDTDLAGKQNKLEGKTNFIPKSTDEDNFENSRLEEINGSLGVNTSRPPTADITLGNQQDKIIAIESSSNIHRGRNLTIKPGDTVNTGNNNPFTISEDNYSNTWRQVDNNLNGDIFYADEKKLYKQVLGFGSIVEVQSFPNNINGFAFDEFGGLYYSLSVIGGGVRYLDSNNNETFLGGNVGDKLHIDRINNNVYSIYDFTKNIFVRSGGLGNFNLFVNVPNRAVDMTTTSNGDLWIIDSHAKVHVVYNGTSDLVEIQTIQNTTANSQRGITTDINDNIFVTTINNKVFFKENGSSSFIELLIDNTFSINSLTSTLDNRIIGVDNSRILVKNLNSEGTPNLKGGDLNLSTGAGKGTAPNRLNFYTYQKVEDGTDMQPETLRGYIDENGWFIYEYPIFADNTSAIAGGLPNNAIYKDNNGNLKSVTI